MPELLTRRETPQSVVGRLAGFKSEWWPTSIRNDGRLPVGISGRLQSESACCGMVKAGDLDRLTFEDDLRYWVLVSPRHLALNWRKSGHHGQTQLNGTSFDLPRLNLCYRAAR